METKNKISSFYKILALISLLAAPPAHAINTQTHLHTCIHTHNGVVRHCNKKPHNPSAATTTAAAMTTANLVPNGDPVSSAIVDIDAAQNGVDNPVTIYLAAGVYTVQPIGKADGGKFDAWNPWGIWRNNVVNCKPDGSDCKKGWIDQYFVAGPFGSYGKHTGLWSTPQLALSNAAPSRFTLEQPAQVSFFVKDQNTRNGRVIKYYFDNVGGVSLMITGGDIPVPSVDLSTDQVSSEGNTVTVTATLSGPAASYPVVIPINIGAQSTAQENSDFTLPSHEIVINAGTTGSSTLALLQDGVFEGDEILVLEMGEPENATKGTQTVSSIRISDYNVAPSVELAVNQGENSTRRVFADKGRVTVTANVVDPNLGDHHRYDWSLSDNRLTRLAGPGASEAEFSFDSSLLQPGFYSLRVTVSDDGMPPLSHSSELLIEIVRPDADHARRDDGDNDAGLAVEDDDDGQDHAMRDSDLDGIADRFDNEDLKDNELQAAASDKDASRFIMRTKPGLKLALGDIAFKAGRHAANISEQDIAEQSDDRRRYSSDKYLHAGGYFDFVVSRLAAAGRSVDVVIPLTEAVPARATYREYTDRLGWRDFVINGANMLKSAKGAPGSCPPPGAAAYREGLIPGSHCLQLTIQDGGPNDNDATANGRVKSLGDVAAAPHVAQPAKASKHKHHRHSRRHRSHNRNHNARHHNNGSKAAAAHARTSKHKHRRHSRRHRSHNRNHNARHHNNGSKAAAAHARTSNSAYKHHRNMNYRSHNSRATVKKVSKRNVD